MAILSDWEDGVLFPDWTDHNHEVSNGNTLSDWEDGVLSPYKTDHEVSKGNNQ